MDRDESQDSPKLFVTKSLLILSYYINTDEIPGELLCKNMISSHVKNKITCYFHM